MQSTKIDLSRDKFRFRLLSIIILLLLFTWLRNSVAFKCELPRDFDVYDALQPYAKLLSVLSRLYRYEIEADDWDTEMREGITSEENEKLIFHRC